MTPDARLSAAIEILEEIEHSTRAAHKILQSYFRSRRYAGSKDRNAIRKKVFDIIRNRARLDWWIADKLGDNDSSVRLRIIASIQTLDKTGPNAFNNFFLGEPYSPDNLNFEEKKLIKSLAGKNILHEAMPLGIRYEVPNWLEKHLQGQWEKNFEKEMSALNTEAPVDLRVNISHVSREQARKSLSIDKIKTKPTTLSPLGLRIIKHGLLEKTKAFKKGLVEVQDEGSQLIAMLCNAKSGMTVVDYCAGAGGKTLALASSMALQSNEKNMSSLIACDISKKKLSVMSNRLKRAGIRDVRKIILPDLDSITKLEGKADRVLVDAPCSGIGIWRRHPEARWKLTSERLDQYLQMQKKIMATASNLVKPGGRLIYATCSLLRQENEQQIEEFLQHNKNFAIKPIRQVWMETIGTECPVNGDELTLSPATTNTDGFFCAILNRNYL